MPYTEDIVAELEAGQALAQTMAHDIARGFEPIIAVALVGAWSRGVVSSVDMDFVAIVRTRRHLKGLIHYLDGYKESSDRPMTLISHTAPMLESRIGRSRWPAAARLAQRLARAFTRELRRQPRVKQPIKWLLGTGLPRLQRIDTSPLNLQTWIPSYDPDGLISRVQARQRRQLQGALSSLEWQFWSPNGFYHLLELYLQGSVDPSAVREVLRSSDVDWKEYLRRCVRYYDEPQRARIADLYGYSVR